MSGTEIPQTHRAVVVDPTVQHEVGIRVESNKAIPRLADDQIMVKVKAVALNPTDNKHVVSKTLKPGDSVGSDFAGDIVAIGSEANVSVDAKGDDKLQIGDAVAGFMRGGVADGQNATFQEYLVIKPEFVWRLPKDSSIPYEDAAPMGGIALSTAEYALYEYLKLPKLWERATGPFTILIWAGSTSVGIYAIKLAKLSGLTVVTTASPKNHELLKSIGADAVFDYNDPSTPDKIRAWSGNSITHTLDNISVDGSTLLAARSMSTEKRGVIATLVPVEKKEGEGWPDNVDVPPRVLIYKTQSPENTDDFSNLVEWNRYLSSNPAIATKLKVMPLTKRPGPGGLDGIPDGLNHLFTGEVSAEKLVYTL